MPARILVVEDNDPSLSLMIYLLEAFGHKPLAAHDGEEGMETALRERPDLILCDIHLPGIDGYDVVRGLKADPICRSTPVIAVTALAMVGDRDRILEAGFDGYLSKPIDPETFVQQVEGFLSLGHSQAHIHATSASVETCPPHTTVARILVVDNLHANLDLARAILQPFGYEVILASGGREALAKAIQDRPDLILSDICMAEGNGYDFIRTVKADDRLSGIPFVFITSTMQGDEDRSRALALGAVRFLRRPIEPQELLAQIKACLAESLLPARHG